MTTDQCASLAVYGEVKRDNRTMEPKAPLTCGENAPTVRSEFFTAPPRITVINPNSLASVTAAIDRAVAPLRRLPVQIACLTSHDGPPGIQTQTEADAAIAPMLALAEREAAASAAFVVACFSDPGLHSLRERVAVPVLGIGESALLTALSIGQRVGVIAMSASAIARHLRYFNAMGVAGRICAERALDLRVADTADADATFARLHDVALRLRDEDHADVLVMGCAGLADLRLRLQEAVGLPVVEPTQAAVGMAIGRLAAEPLQP